jgi:hypothetical protein
MSFVKQVPKCKIPCSENRVALMTLFKLKTCCLKVKGEARKDVLNSTSKREGGRRGKKCV